jgi:DNA-binding MarR family transcriptional regulator
MMNTNFDTKSKAALLAVIEKTARERERAVAAFDDVVTEKININKSDLRILDALMDGPATPSTLVKKTGLTPSAMTSALDRLEKKKFVIRNRNSHDRRKVIIEPTDEVTDQIIVTFYNPILLEENKALSKLNAGELKIIYDYLCLERELHKKNLHRLLNRRVRNRTHGGVGGRLPN